MKNKNKDKILDLNRVKSTYLDDEVDEFIRKTAIDDADMYEKYLQDDPEFKHIKAPDDMLLEIQEMLAKRGYQMEVFTDEEMAAFEEREAEDLGAEVLEPTGTEGAAQSEEGAYSESKNIEIMTRDEFNEFKAWKEWKNLSNNNSFFKVLNKAAQMKRGARRAVGACVACIMVMVLTLSGSANKMFLSKTSENFVKDITEINYSNYAQEAEFLNEMVSIYEEIYSEIKILSPILTYAPYGFEINEYYINDLSNSADILFKYTDQNYLIVLSMYGYENDYSITTKYSNSGYVENYVETQYGVADIYLFEDDNMLVAELVYNNTLYRMSGIIEMNELVKIIENWVIQ